MRKKLARIFGNGVFHKSREEERAGCSKGCEIGLEGFDGFSSDE